MIITRKMVQDARFDVIRITQICSQLHYSVLGNYQSLEIARRKVKQARILFPNANVTFRIQQVLKTN